MIKEGVYVSVLQSHIIAECFCSREVAITTESITGANYLYRSKETPNFGYLNVNCYPIWENNSVIFNFCLPSQ